MPSLTIRPGSRIRLKGQSEAVPDFLVVGCENELCWIRQQNWSPAVRFSVKFTQISIPDPQTEDQAIPTRPRAEVICLETYRRRRQAVSPSR